MALPIEKLNGDTIAMVLDYLGPQDRLNVHRAISGSQLANAGHFAFQQTCFLLQLKNADRNVKVLENVVDNLALCEAVEVDSTKYVSMMPSKLLPSPESGLDVTKTYHEHYEEAHFWPPAKNQKSHHDISKLKAVDLKKYRKKWLFEPQGRKTNLDFQATAFARLLFKLAFDKEFLPGTCRSCLVHRSFSDKRGIKSDERGFSFCRTCFAEKTKLKKQEEKIKQWLAKKQLKDAAKAAAARIQAQKKAKSSRKPRTSK